MPNLNEELTTDCLGQVSKLKSLIRESPTLQLHQDLLLFEALTPPSVLKLPFLWAAECMSFEKRTQELFKNWTLHTSSSTNS